MLRPLEDHYLPLDSPLPHFLVDESNKLVVVIPDVFQPRKPELLQPSYEPLELLQAKGPLHEGVGALTHLNAKGSPIPSAHTTWMNHVATFTGTGLGS